MLINQQDIQRIKEILFPAIGKNVWGAKLPGVGSFISMEFGEPTPCEWDSGSVRGEWSLLTDMCEWRLEKDGDIFVGSEDHRSRIAPALQSLDELILLNVNIELPALDTIFVFSNRTILRIFRASFIDDRFLHWIFKLPEYGRALEIGPGATWSIQNYTYNGKKTGKGDR